MGETAATRVMRDLNLREATAVVMAAVMAVPPADRVDVTAVALRALIDTGALEGYRRG